MEPRIVRNLEYAWRALGVLLSEYNHALTDSQRYVVATCRELLVELLLDVLKQS